MNICGGNRHEDIVYDGRTCPLCELINVRDNLEADKSYLEDKLSSSERKVEELEEKVSELQGVIG